MDRIKPGEDPLKNATLIAIVFLKERVTWQRFGAIVLVGGGAALLLSLG